MQSPLLIFCACVCSYEIFIQSPLLSVPEIHWHFAETLSSQPPSNAVHCLLQNDPHGHFPGLFICAIKEIHNWSGLGAEKTG